MPVLEKSTRLALKDRRPVGQVRKSVTITTTAETNTPQDSVPFPRDMNYKRYVSEICFSDPVKDRRGRKHERLKLNTYWYFSLGRKGPVWEQSLYDEQSICLNEVFVGQLEEAFSSYSKSRLREWQEQAFDTHEAALAEITKEYLKRGRVALQNLL